MSDIVRTTADAPKVTTEEGLFFQFYFVCDVIFMGFAVGESKRQNNRSVIDFTALDDVGVSF